jgi:hypothetical protein
MAKMDDGTDRDLSVDTSGEEHTVKVHTVGQDYNILDQIQDVMDMRVRSLMMCIVHRALLTGYDAIFIRDYMKERIDTCVSDINSFADTLFFEGRRSYPAGEFNGIEELKGTISADVILKQQLNDLDNIIEMYGSLADAADGEGMTSLRNRMDDKVEAEQSFRATVIRWLYPPQYQVK